MVHGARWKKAHSLARLVLVAAAQSQALAAVPATRSPGFWPRLLRRMQIDFWLAWSLPDSCPRSEPDSQVCFLRAVLRPDPQAQKAHSFQGLGPNSSAEVKL